MEVLIGLAYAFFFFGVGGVIGFAMGRVDRMMSDTEHNNAYGDDEIET